MTDDRNRDAFVRWQGITISQMSYAINLVLGLAVAALGFLVNLLVNADFVPVAGQGVMLAVALCLLVASVVLGIICVVNRLRDFRVTARIARGRQKESPAEELAPLREHSRRLGRRTWGLFWWQIGTFGGGVVLATVGVGLTLGEKLW